MLFMSFVCDMCVDVGLGCEWRIRDLVLNVDLVKVGFECECWCLFKGEDFLFELGFGM